MSLRIAMIGAGSVGFTRRLMRDILSVPELGDTTFALHDISEHNMEMVTQLCRRDIEANNLPAKVESTLDRRAAIAGADYVISMIRQGGLEAFQTDIDIPLKYGVDQCVGDTLCAGGLMYAQRTIPALLDFCKDIREVAKPDALFLNYSNPMAMNTWACNKYGGVKTIGLCHGFQGAHWQIASCTEHWARRKGLIGPDEKINRKDVDVVAAGINHQTWFIKAQWRGIDLIPIMTELFEGHPDFPRTEKVRIDVLKRFGYYSTESNGHLSEYLPWYRKRVGEIPDWIDLSSWINGETGGYLRICTEGRNWFEHDFPNWMAEAPPKFTQETRSEEHGSWIIEAQETGRVYRGHFNVVNDGHITNLPNGCVIEIPGYVDRNGINMPVVGDLPLACAATCSASVRVQEMGMEAAVHGDTTLLKQAMLHDPLVGAVCNPEEVWQMTDELLVAQAQWLPQYKTNGEIAAAAKRLDEAVKSGTRVKTVETQGAARLHTATVDEMQARADESRANAQAADKGKMTKVERKTISSKRVVSFGEVLWDLLPDGARLGGAPLNFSVRAQALGNDVGLISSIGNDPLGAKALDEMTSLGLDTDTIAHNPDLPTGTVTVEFENGQPRYVIHENVAYDAIPLSDEVKNLASSADCFYFGTLIQRSEISRRTLRELLSLVPKSCVRFVDLNLRKNCFSDETIRWSVENADIVKLSEEEIPEVAAALGIDSPQKPAQMAESLCRSFPMSCCVVTCGAEGATASSTRSGSLETAEAKASTGVVVDTVGAGDSFSAGFVHGWLLGLSLEKCLGLGNGMGALAVSKAGGTTPFTDNEIRALLSKFA